MKTPLLKSLIFAVVFMMAIFVFVSATMGQTNTWNGNTSVNWNTSTNWSLGVVPTTAHDVVIPDNKSVTINTAAFCKSFTINGGDNAQSITISSTNSLTVSNVVSIGGGTGNGDDKYLIVGSGALTCASVTIAATGHVNAESEIQISTGIVNVTGNITMNGGSEDNYIRFSSNGILNLGGNITGGSLVASTNTVNYNGTNQSIGAYSCNNLTFSNSGTKTATGAITVSSALTINSNITLDMVTSALSGNSLTTSGTGILLTQNTAVTPIPTGRTWSFDVNYNRSGNQTVSAGTYSNLTFSGSGTKSMSAATIVSSNVTIEEGTILDELSYQMTLGNGSTLTVNGTLDFSSSTGSIRTGNNVNATLVMGSNG